MPPEEDPHPAWLQALMRRMLRNDFPRWLVWLLLILVVLLPGRCFRHHGEELDLRPSSPAASGQTYLVAGPRRTVPLAGITARPQVRHEGMAGHPLVRKIKMSWVTR